MRSEERRSGARIITELGVVIFPSQGGAPIDDRATAHDVTARGFKVETQAQLAENALVSFTLELPRGLTAAGKGRVVWSNQESATTWAGVEIVAMARSDRRRLDQLLNPDRVDWARLWGLCVTLVMSLTVIAAVQRILFSAHLRGLCAQFAPKFLALLVMGWALAGLLKRGRR